MTGLVQESGSIIINKDNGDSLSPDSFADQTSLSFQQWVANHKGVCILHSITNWVMLQAQKNLTQQ